MKIGVPVFEQFEHIDGPAVIVKNIAAWPHELTMTAELVSQQDNEFLQRIGRDHVVIAVSNGRATYRIAYAEPEVPRAYRLEFVSGVLWRTYFDADLRRQDD